VKLAEDFVTLEQRDGTSKREEKPKQSNGVGQVVSIINDGDSANDNPVSDRRGRSCYITDHGFGTASPTAAQQLFALPSGVAGVLKNPNVMSVNIRRLCFQL
jgi:hypothetical protein